MLNNLLTKLAAMSWKNVGIGALVVAGFYYFAFFNDGSAIDKRIEQLQTQLKQEEAKSKESDEALKEVDAARNSVGILNEQFKTAAQQLPSEIQPAEIIRSVNVVARSAGVVLKTTEPRQTKRDDIVESMPLKVVIQGSFSELMMFLYYVSSMERIMRVTTFTIAPPPNEKIPTGEVIFDGEILSYKYLGDQKAGEKNDVKAGARKK
ncbi:MAG: hypothetical protein BroJett040_18000 [Oligoflexia bacterium]|nr:MAG: hypothetical protein BroJett040_18000 [Oligoflexia bacterium]